MLQTCFRSIRKSLRYKKIIQSKWKNYVKDTHLIRSKGTGSTKDDQWSQKSKNYREVFSSSITIMNWLVTLGLQTQQLQ